jgi:hypothetical protein
MRKSSWGKIDEKDHRKAFEISEQMNGPAYKM